MRLTTGSSTTELEAEPDDESDGTATEGEIEEEEEELADEEGVLEDGPATSELVSPINGNLWLLRKISPEELLLKLLRNSLRSCSVSSGALLDDDPSTLFLARSKDS